MLREIDRGPIAEALALLPRAMDTDRARVQMLAIGLQESGLQERVQRGGGPARGLWQFERGGGVRGVLEHPAVKSMALHACQACGVLGDPGSAWIALATDDVLAAAFARLLLWTDPRPMAGNADDGWALYLRTWRPGRPRPETWVGNHSRARAWVFDGIDS